MNSCYCQRVSNSNHLFSFNKGFEKQQLKKKQSSIVSWNKDDDTYSIGLLEQEVSLTEEVRVEGSGEGL